MPAEWVWDETRDHVEECVQLANLRPEYEVLIEGPEQRGILDSIPFPVPETEPTPRASLWAGGLEPGFYFKVAVRDSETGHVILHRPAHAGSTFEIVGDVLYWLDYSPAVQYVLGELVAINLRTGRELWRSALDENQAINQSLWSTEAWLRLHAGRVTVYVKEHGEPSAVVTFDALTGRLLRSQSMRR